MAPFRVIIVGGGITGLALANMLEKYEIDFAVLEKHEDLTPQLGAGYAMLPHGARILDQLGCFEKLESLSMPVNSLAGYDDTGRMCTYLPDLGSWLEESLGYKMAFLERRQVLQVLYNNLHDKSKIHSPCRALDISLTDTGVQVETDGGVFDGDIVIGADGVHSHVRREMERLAVADGLQELFRKEEDFKCSYRGIFGTSEITNGVVMNEAIKCYRDGRSYLCSPGKGGILYWILFVKNEKETQGKANPRYTAEDRDKLIAQYASDIIKPGITLGDLFQKARVTTLVPLEQGVLSTCFYKRMVLVGDAWHKFNPLTGQGGNAAIASAAYLTDGLRDLIDHENEPSQASIEKLFLKYRHDRGLIARGLTKHAHTTQRMEALETPWLKFVQLNLVPFLSLRRMGFWVVQSFNAGFPLKYLPPTSRHGTVPIPRRQDEKAVQGWMGYIVKLCIILLVPILLGYYILV